MITFRCGTEDTRAVTIDARVPSIGQYRWHWHKSSVLWIIGILPGDFCRPGTSCGYCGLSATNAVRGEQAMDHQVKAAPMNDPPPTAGGRASKGWSRKLVALIILALVVTVVGAMLLEFVIESAVELFARGRVDPRYTPSRQVDLEELQPALQVQPLQPIDSTPELRIAIAPVISPEKSLQIYRELVDYLAEKLDRTPVFMQRETYVAVNDLVRYGRCEVAMVCTYAFVRGEREFGMQVLVVPQINGVITYHSLFLVPESSHAESLLDLRGKRFGSADLFSNSGWLYPVSWLNDQGEEPDRFFGDHVITGSHDRSVTAVASGYVDGAAVDSLVFEQMIEEDPSLTKKVRLIHKSPPFGMPPIVVPRQIDPALKEEVRNALLEMSADPQGKKILNALRIEQFVVPDNDLFDSVRKSAQLLESQE